MSGMRDLKTLAQELMQMPSGDGVTTAGPAFEYVAPATAPVAETKPGGFTITVRKDGPYVVEGGVPLARKSIVYSEWHEPMTWQKDAVMGAKPLYRLCRCGQSQHKPYCDNTHARVGFDGAETAPVTPSADRRERIAGEHITVTDDHALCTRAGFCGNRVEKVWDMVARAGDSRVRFEIIQRVERCPSGRLAYELENGVVEPDLPAGDRRHERRSVLGDGRHHRDALGRPDARDAQSRGALPLRPVIDQASLRRHASNREVSGRMMIAHSGIDWEIVQS